MAAHLAPPAGTVTRARQPPGASLRVRSRLTEPLTRLGVPDLREPAQLWAAIGICALAASRRCPLKAISSRMVLATGHEPLPVSPSTESSGTRFVRARGVGGSLVGVLVESGGTVEECPKIEPHSELCFLCAIQAVAAREGVEKIRPQE